MLAKDIAAASQHFLSHIGSIDPRIVASSKGATEDAGQFRDIFRNDDDFSAGVYWFALPDGTVFDIGKSDTSVWKRICHQAGKPVPQNSFVTSEARTGPGWGFPESQHLKYNIGKTSPITQAAIRSGEFHVGWISVEPSHLASLLEVYLHTLCLAVDKLPELCYRIG